jgi:cytochrome P450
VESFAYPLPVILVAEILGASYEDRFQFKHWTADFLAFQGTGRADFQRTLLSQESLVKFVGYVEGLVESRRAEPQEDLISALVEADYRDRELVATCCTLLVAGHETTTNLLGNIVRLLSRHPEQLEDLRANQELVEPAIEEILRYDAPKQRNFRRAMKDHTFAGAPIAENEMVFQIIGSANHDERIFEAPESLDIRRRNNPHLTFGAGIHFCVGAVLARLEARIFLEYFLNHKGSIRVLDGGDAFAWQERVQMRGPGRLMLEVQ